MRNLKPISAIILTIVCININATVHTVDNNPSSSADFSLLANAIASAAEYDTIYLAGSPYQYDGTNIIRINKKGLVIIGPGYFLGNNPKTQANNNTAKIYELHIGQGADSVIVMGLDFSSRYLYVSDNLSDGSDGTTGPTGVVIKRNKISQLYLGASTTDNAISGTSVLQNYFNNNSTCIYIYTNNVAGTLIQNNIINHTSSGDAIYSYSGNNLSNTTIRNNTIVGDFSYVYSADIYNNIFSTGSTLDACNNNNVYNNVFAEASIFTSSSTGNTDINNLKGQLVTNFFKTTPQVYDVDYILGITSPALGAGVEGEDAGAFGGMGYVLSGLPPVPSIYEIITTGYGSAADGMNVTIKVKSNQ